MASHQPHVLRKQANSPNAARKTTSAVVPSPSYLSGNVGDMGFPKTSGKVISATKRAASFQESIRGSTAAKKERSGRTRADSARIAARSTYAGATSAPAVASALESARA